MPYSDRSRFAELITTDLDHLMELAQLKAFVTVAEEQNLTRAAARLFLTPPSVSARIKALEEELGLQLFERTSSGMTLSPQGQQLKPQAELLLRNAAQFTDSARALQNSIEGNVRIGLNTSPLALKASALVANLKQNYPKLEVSLLPSVSATICEQVSQEKMDAGFVYGEIPQGNLANSRLHRTRVVVIAPAAWKEKLAGLDQSGLTAQPWIWVSTICPYVHLLRALFSSQQRPDNIVASADDEQTTLDLVRAGVGLGIVDAGLAANSLQQSEIIELPLGPFEIDLSLVYLRRRQQDPLLRILLTSLAELWSDMSALSDKTFEQAG